MGRLQAREASAHHDQLRRTEKLQALRGRRDDAAVKNALGAVEEAARGDANLMPLILDAVERYATLGEISDALRNVFGVYQDQFTF